MSKLFKITYDDVNTKMIRHIEGRRYHAIEVTDMIDACGEKEIGKENKWAVELKEIDLDLLTDKQIKDALRFIGQDKDQDPGMNDEWLADACFDYGSFAPMFSGQGSNRNKLITQAKRESRSLDDPIKHSEAMDRPVNAIGSTAREYGQGDIFSAMIRGASQGKPDAKIMLKMYGAKDEDINALQAPIQTPMTIEQALQQAPVQRIALGKIPSDDPLAYMTGFMDGQANREKPAPTDELAPAYLAGYRHAIAVRLGESEKPTWIK